MHTPFQCHRITSCDDASFPKLIEVFEASFPENERRPLHWFKELVEAEPRFHCMAYSDALLCYWHFGSFVYVEYLATNPSRRNGGMGTRLMQEFLASVGVPVVLEVEPPESELTKRRVGFYERLGFRLLPDDYVQPSYGVVPGLPLRLMIQGEQNIPTSEIISTIHREVYGVK